MYTASQQKKENIAEYLLYMWHIEDLIRANNFDIEKIEETILSKYTSLSPDEKKKLRDWYESLIDMMAREGVKERGHIQLNENVLIQLNDLHNRLISSDKYPKYSSLYYQILPMIVELRAKAGKDKVGEIETAFNALYGLMMLRLSRKEISKETQTASKEISMFLAMLSHYYKLDYNNELVFED